MSKVQDDLPERSAAEHEWLERNLERQRERHLAIVRNMDELAEQRDVWIDEFLARLQTRGFNYNCDQLCKIADDELPVKPDRPFRVVF